MEFLVNSRESCVRDEKHNEGSTYVNIVTVSHVLPVAVAATTSRHVNFAPYQHDDDLCMG